MSGILNMLLSGGEAGVVALSNVTANGPNATSCSYSLQNDGSQTATGETLDDWVVPGSVADQYEVRFSNAAGDTGELSGATFGTWLSLGTSRTVTLAAPSPGPGTFNVTFDVEIRNAASTVVKASCEVDLTTTTA